MQDPELAGVFIHVEDVESPNLNEETVSNWLAQVATAEEYKIGCINLIFCSDDYLLEVNREHLDHDYYTDIITFDYSERNIVSGDLFISVDRVKDNAATQEVAYNTELHRVIVHGVLHLLGYKDKSEEDIIQMRAKETQYIALVN